MRNHGETGRSPSGRATRASAEPQERLGHPTSVPNAAQRRNLLKLAAYLESLPVDYKHFDMSAYTGHEGDCDLPGDEELLAATKPSFFLSNCGTVACAAGHGPAAGIRVPATAFFRHGRRRYGVNWMAYIAVKFGVEKLSWDFLFSGAWDGEDNHHYGAAARIRYFLATGIPPEFFDEDNGVQFDRSPYASYRKGSRSEIRRQIEQVSA